MTSSTAVFTQELEAIAETLRRSTVQIQGRQDGNGSGVIWSADGVIITNAHVVHRQVADVKFSDGRELIGRVIGRDVQRDLVALQVDATDLPAAAIADSTMVRVGEVAIAVGNPLGQIGALTLGIVHSVGNPAQRAWIQTDLKLAPGNSGGVLANAQGEAIGINTMIVGGRGFAIPSQVVERFLQTTFAAMSETRSDAARSHPRLGVTLQPVRLAIAGRYRRGWLITDVESGSPAETAHLQRGDIIAGLRSKPFHHPGELFHVLQHSQWGDGVPLWVLRGTQITTVDVVLWNNSFQAQTA